MRKTLALLWLAVVVGCGLHLGLQASRGMPLATDLMALLPREDRDPGLQQAKDAATRELSQRILVLVGHADRATARTAAETLRRRLVEASVIEAAGDVPGPEALRRLGQAYFPHRTGLLAEADRKRLAAGDGEALVTRALSQVYGVGGIADARLLAADPFLLFPAFLGALPVPASRLSLDDGLPTVAEAGTTWVLVSGKLTGEAYALAFQTRAVAAVEAALADAPGVKVLRLGTVFYAHAGAGRALAESGLIGLVSLAGTVMLMLLAFRGLRPLLLGVTAIAVGLATALSACLAWFGQLHAIALMFGAGLIGVAVDYSLHYFGQVFTARAQPAERLAAERLTHVLPGLALGLGTTVIGYAALALAPLPGLVQVAVFSGVGLVGSFLTVVLWFPLLDREPCRPLPEPLQRGALALWRFWERPRCRVRTGLLALLAGAGALGLAMLSVDDDVRRQQSLDTTLAAEQAELQRLTGFAHATQFFLVRAADTEAALAAEERLGERLAPLAAEGALSGWRGPARFVPSAARQQADAALVAAALERPHLAAFRARIGMPEPTLPPPRAERPLVPAALAVTGALPLLTALTLAPGVHLVALEGVRDPAALATAASGLDGVRFVDPTTDMSELLGAYRRRAVVLLALSALLMVPLLAWRYGWRGASAVMAPPVVAVALAPPLLALAGLPFSFFGAMALVLVLSIGVDYAVFCAEDANRRDPATLLSVGLAMLTTLLSFGLLALSEVAGVRAFGATMLAGIALSFLLAPFAGRAKPRSPL